MLLWPRSERSGTHHQGPDAVLPASPPAKDPGSGPFRWGRTPRGGEARRLGALGAAAPGPRTPPGLDSSENRPGLAPDSTPRPAGAPAGGLLRTCVDSPPHLTWAWEGRQALGLEPLTRWASRSRFWVAVQWRPTLCDPTDCSSQASLSFTISQSLLKLTSIELVMPSNHLTLCHPLLLLPSMFPSIRVFSSESTLRIRWPKHWNFSFSPLNIQSFVPTCKTALLPCKPSVHPAASTAVSGGGPGHIGSFMQTGPVSFLSLQPPTS